LSLFRIPAFAKIIVAVPNNFNFLSVPVPDAEKLFQLALSCSFACRSSFSRASLLIRTRVGIFLEDLRASTSRK